MTAMEKVKLIREFFDNQDIVPMPIHAYIIPHEDPHMSEYISDVDKRLEFVSEFTGSAGTVVITKEHAHLWTDGRYYIQATEEIPAPFELMKLTATSGLSEWLTENIPPGLNVGGDPSLFACSEWGKLSEHLAAHSICLLKVETNLVDLIWANKPERVHNPIVIHDLMFSGSPSSTKIRRVALEMQKKKCDLHVVSELDNIAWLLNLRGTDIEYNPLFFSFVIIMVDEGEIKVSLFLDKTKVTSEILNHFASQDLKVVGHHRPESPGSPMNISLSIHEYEDVYIKLHEMSRDATRVWFSNTCNHRLYTSVSRSHQLKEPSIVTRLKAVKNDEEAQGMVNAHNRDGYALSRFLMWLENEIEKGTVITEISAATKLEEFRSLEDNFRGLSFPTISSVGKHAAIIHHHPQESSDERISKDQIYLVDSGGQYWDGTTDVTRTIHLGVPTDFQKQIFTRVLKGVISLNTAIFPSEVKGNVLDAFARRPLWEFGLEYRHGTGHGVGSYLCVHEGPIGISYKQLLADCGLRENMFVSNEPGCYLDNQFGVRIENIERIVKAETTNADFPLWKKYMNGSETQFLTFQTVTMCPIQTKLIDPDVMTESEIAWLNSYHNQVRNTLLEANRNAGSRRDRHFDEWLIKQTEPISKKN